MPESNSSFTFLTRHIQNLRGGSQPILAQASDGQLYVVKFANNPQGANVCFNESAGSELYRAFGLAVPSWKQLMVTDSFLDRNPDCWMLSPEGRLRPESGMCFGSLFLGGKGVRMLEILPRNSFKRVQNHQSFWKAWMIDICAEHADNRQAIFLEGPQRDLEAFFVDMGHGFGGPKGELRPRLQASRYLDPCIYQCVSSEYLQSLEAGARHLDADLLWHRIQTLPDNWKTRSALDAFARCLGNLSTSSLIESILNVMVETLRQANGREYKNLECGPRTQASVLHPGVQAAELGQRFVANSAGHPACA